MRPTILMIKQHNVTGLKYFHKTILLDKIDTYHGSGIYWKRHLKKHGNDWSNIWVSEVFTDKSDLVEFATLVSEMFNIVESDEWANLVIENGISGGAINNGVILTEEHKAKISKSHIGKHVSDETKNKMSMAHVGKQTEEQRLSRSKATRQHNLSRNLPKVTCNHCNKIGSYVAMHRWHFDNCKFIKLEK